MELVQSFGFSFRRTQNTSQCSLNWNRIKCDQAISTCLSLSPDENCTHVSCHHINPDFCGGENELNHIFSRCNSLVQLFLLSLMKVAHLWRTLRIILELPDTCEDFRSVRLTSRIKRTFERLVLKQLWPGPTAGTQVWMMPSSAFSTGPASTWLRLALLSGLIFNSLQHLSVSPTAEQAQGNASRSPSSPYNIQICEECGQLMGLSIQCYLTCICRYVKHTHTFCMCVWRLKSTTWTY